MYCQRFIDGLYSTNTFAMQISGGPNYYNTILKYTKQKSDWIITVMAKWMFGNANSYWHYSNRKKELTWNHFLAGENNIGHHCL